MVSTSRRTRQSGARNETTGPDDDPCQQRCSGRALDAVTPLVRRQGTVPDDEQLTGYRSNASQRKRERRVRDTERAKIPNAKGPGDQEAKHEVGAAREQLVRKRPPEPADHASGALCRKIPQIPEQPGEPARACPLEEQTRYSGCAAPKRAARHHARDGGAEIAVVLRADANVISCHATGAPG